MLKWFEINNTLVFILRQKKLNKNMLDKETQTEMGEGTGVLPVEYITMSQINYKPSDSILLKTIEYLLSLNWPHMPAPPPEINLGATMELFLRNIINKSKLDSVQQQKQQSCKLPEHFEQAPPQKGSLDYNEFLKVLQTVLAESSTAKKSSAD